jgi:hypothetical protein
MNERSQNETDQPIAVDQPGIYRIKIQGRLSDGALRRFDEFEISVSLNAKGLPITTLTGQIADQAALHGIVARIRDLGLPLVLVELLSVINRGN